MKNNKLTRKRAERLAKKQVVTQQLDGTEVLHSKESKQKNRRWTFEADVIMTVPGQKNEETGEVSEPVVLPMRTMKMDSAAYCTVKEVKQDCASHEAYLRSMNGFMKTAQIHVRAIPHETVSNVTMRQLMGYRDMAGVLDRALELAITEAQDVVIGKTVGTQFTEVAANEESGAAARTLSGIKEDFYKRAMEILRPRAEEISKAQEASSQSAIVITDAASAALDEEPRPAFVPEIVNEASLI